MTRVATDATRTLAVGLLGSPSPPVDPYPGYHRLRTAAPRLHDPQLGTCFLTTYDDCARALRDPKLGRAPEDVPSRLNGDVTATRRRRPSMLFLNPPDHTRQRRLVSRGFTPRRVEALRPRVRELTDERLDTLADAGEVDVMDLLAFPLPVAVIGELVGVPRADQAAFRWWAQDLTTRLDPIQDEGKVARADRAGAFFDRYFRELIAARRREPRDDLITVLVEAEDAGDVLDDDEIVSTAVLLFAAGFETTTNLVGNGLLALLRNPDKLMRLRADPSLVGPAVEEMLRYDSPVQVNGRYALEDTEIGGSTVPAGTSVVTFLGAANRDPDRFPDPDRFDVGREQGAALSFGGGIHHCLGAALARLEAQVVFDRLLARFDELELTAEPSWRPSVTLRGVEELWVGCRPR